MDILITGGSGFIAKNLTNYLKLDGHTVYAEGRNTLDLLDSKQVMNFSNHVDVIIHTAIQDKKSNVWPYGQNEFSFYNNLLMFENAMSIPHKLFINIASGAEFNKYQEIICAEERDIYKNVPKDFYGLAKSIIAKRVHGINLRLFNCFGIGEAPRSLITNAFIKAEKNEPICLQKKWMDFFYIKDLYIVIKHLLDKQMCCDINCVYEQKYTLEGIVKIVQQTVGIENEIQFGEYSPSYTGSGHKLSLFKLPLLGLRDGIKEMYEIRNQNDNCK